MIAGLIAIAFLIVLLNGFAAGIVAFVHFFRDAGGVMKRALAGALGSGIACTALILFVAASEGAGAFDGSAIIAAVAAIIAACGFLVSLPGAYILSRKIGDGGRVDPDTFS